MPRPLVPRLSLVLLAGAAVSLGAVLVLTLGRPETRATPDRPHVSPDTGLQTPIPLTEIYPAAKEDAAKPRYRGPLGDFVVLPREGSAYPPCPSPHAPADPKTSELYSPVFGNGEEARRCANGVILGISSYGQEAIGRRYFVGEAKVPYEAPLDRLKLLTVAGKPAIAETPIPGVPPGYIRLAVIERFPTADQPGIMTWIDNTTRPLDGAMDLAKQIMGVQ